MQVLGGKEKKKKASLQVMLSQPKTTQPIIRVSLLFAPRKTTCHLIPYCDAPSSGCRGVSLGAAGKRGAAPGVPQPGEGGMRVPPLPLGKGLRASHSKAAPPDASPNPASQNWVPATGAQNPTLGPLAGSAPPRPPPQQPSSQAQIRPPPPSSGAPAKPSLRHRPHRVPQRRPVTPEPVVLRKRPRKA